MRIRENLFPIFVGIASFLLFLFFQATGIYGGDSGDLVTAAATFGVPHPPGYPLYTFLGWLLSGLPLVTPAWRVGLLSSLPHAVAVALVYWLVKQLTKQRAAGLFAACSLVGNYLFFLYSTTPEVFALFDLFVIGLTVLLFQWRQTRDIRYLYAASFIFGLSLSHHQVILFLVPAIAYWIWQHKHALKHWFIGLLVYWVIGLFPYLYLPIAGSGSSIINWNRPVDFTSFFRLVTRADYGSFVSSGFYGTLVSQRVVQLKAYAQFLLLDLTPVGIALILVGLWRLWKDHRRAFWFIAIAFVSMGPVFFFYASFPLVNRFTLGTYERFLLPSYVFFALVIGVGFWYIVERAGVIARRIGSRVPLLWMGAIGVVLSLYPVSMLGITVWRFWGLSRDRTADNLGRDILASVKPNSLLFLQRDTPLFTTQYVRYGLGVRPDVVAIHTSRLVTPDYPKVLARTFPQLSIPKATGAAFAVEFVKANRGHFPIATNEPFPVEEGWLWVPQGFVYQLVSKDQVPSVDALVDQNEQMWREYHDPRAGILGRYNHLMLSDVPDVYAGARFELGKTLLRAGSTDRAREQFEKAIALGGDTQTSDAYTFLGLSYLFIKNCDAALAAFARARGTSIIPDDSLLLYEGVTYRDCVGNAERAKELLDAYEKLRKKAETPLPAR